MRLGKVIGNVVSTQKNTKLEGAKLLIVQPISAFDERVGSPVLAVDAAQAGVGDRVLLVLEGRAAISVLRQRAAPVDAAIIGVLDYVNVSTPAKSRN